MIRKPTTGRNNHFYPRSPYGERLQERFLVQSALLISIHALLTESDRQAFFYTAPHTYFYPRSPYGERPVSVAVQSPASQFLSTLSLRRATVNSVLPGLENRLFLSTLSLRRATGGNVRQVDRVSISIHALLTESDC